MKKIYILVALLFGLLVSGCGEEVDESVGRAYHLQLILPSSLPKQSPRFRALQSRAEYLLLKVKTSGGVNYENKFSPQSWASLSIPEMAFPVDQNDALSIEIEIWDRKLDGTRRSFAVMEGKAKRSAKELEGDTTIPVKLGLKVSPESYD